MVTQGRTRRQIRQAIGYNLGAIYVSSTTSQVDDASLIDTSLRGGDDSHNGKWVVASASTGSITAGDISRVSDYTQSSTDCTVAPPFSGSIPSGMEYELWDSAYEPQRIHALIDAAIMDATGRVYTDLENLDVFADGRTTRYDIPADLDMINRIEYRNTVTSKRIHECNATFDEKTDSDFTQSLDTQDRKQGNQSLKMVIAAGASAGDFVTDSITSTDLSKYDYVELWVKSTVATSAGNLKLLLDDSASCASPLETLSIPALSADTWTYCRIALSNPETDTAIISVGFEYDADLNACTVWLDDIKAVVNSSAVWDRLPHNLWSVDRASRDLVFTSDGRSIAGYRLLKISGGAKPGLLTAESTTSDVDDWYVIARATALAIQGTPGQDPGENRRRATQWFAIAEMAWRSMPILQNVRMIS
jgi:hypothetical protein